MGEKPKILIVEDERIVAEDIQRSLQTLGYSVSGVVSSGREALKQMKADQPDLVLMDIVLKGRMNGIETADAIRFQFDVPVVYLTAYADMDTLDKAKVTEPFGYILKPFNNSELQSTIEMALYKHRMEAKLKESEAWFSTTLRSIGDGVITTDKQGHVTFMNSIAEILTGWKQQEAIGKPLAEVLNIVDKETGKAIRSPVKRILNQEIVAGLPENTILISKQGIRIPVDDSAAPIKNERGRIIGVVVVFKDITERKKAEEALRESERKLATLMGNLPGMAYRCLNDAHWTMEFISEGCFELTGHEPSVFIGEKALSFREIVHVLDRNNRAEQISKALQADRPFRMMYRIKTLSGTEKWVWEQGVGVHSLEGEYIFLEGFIHDITERKRIEEALRVSEERYRGLFQTMDQGVIYYDQDLKMVACNPAAEKILGFSMRDMAGMTLLESGLHPITEDGVNFPENGHPVIRALRTGESASNAVMGIQTPEGDRRWLLVSATPVFSNGQKSPRAVFTTFTNITHRKEVELALKERNIQLNSMNVISQAIGGTLELKVILDKALHEVLAISKFSGGVIFLFHEKETMIDLEVHEGISLQIIELLSKTYADIDSNFRRIVLQGRTQRFHSKEFFEGRKIRKQNDLNYMYCLVVPIKAGDLVVGGLHLFGREEYMPEEIVFDFFTNIGSHIGMAVKNAKLYERTNQTLEQLRITQNKLVQSEKLAGLGALASNVVHEIGNPLAAIANSVQVLQDRIVLDGRMKELMDIIVWETERLTRSVDALREFSRPKQLRFIQNDIREVIKKAIMVLNQDFELVWGRKIHAKIPRRFPLIWMDADSIEQMMINLLKNGLQAVEEGGVVEVWLSMREKDSRKIAVVQVKDDGPGISREIIQHVFEPYFSTKARGMGLGMHIVKQSVESHHGNIHIDSEEGKGTKVIIQIPIERGENGEYTDR